MIIRRHGYNGDIEVGSVTLIDSKEGLFAVWEDTEGNITHNEYIESVFNEGDNLFLFTSENW